MKPGDLVEYVKAKEYGIDELALILTKPYQTKPRVHWGRSRTVVTILWQKSTKPCVEDADALKVISCAAG